MKLNFKEYGEGKPLIILHGLLGSLDNWNTLGKRFARDRKVYLVDQRNHGKSPHTENHDYPSMVSDLKSFIEDHNIETPDILGHSMGGKTAMFFGTQYPHLMDRMIVVDIAPRSYPVHHHTILEGLNAVDFDKQTSREEVDAVLAKYIPEPVVRQFLLKNVYWVEKGKLGYRFNLDAITKDIVKVSEGLSEDAYFTNPALFIDGDNSNYILEEDHEMIDDIFVQNQLLTIADAGHWVHAEKPEVLMDAVETFLGRD